MKKFWQNTVISPHHWFLSILEEQFRLVHWKIIFHWWAYTLKKNYNLFVDAEDKLLPGNELKLSVPAITVFELKMQKKFNVCESVCANCAICIPSCRLTCLLPSWLDKNMEARTNIKWRWSSHQQIVSRVCTESIVPVPIQVEKNIITAHVSIELWHVQYT